MPSEKRGDEHTISVPIGRIAVAKAPARLCTLLGSCVGVVLHDPARKAGGIAHILLPSSQGAPNDHVGKYADTAIPSLLVELDRVAGAGARSRVNARLAGGATMFQTNQTLAIGERNLLAVEQILLELRIPILGRDVGGQVGRRVTLETTSGRVLVKIPGGAEYDV